MSNKIISFSENSGLTDNQRLGIDPIFLDISLKTYKNPYININASAYYKNIQQEESENVFHDEEFSRKLVIQTMYDNSKEIEAKNELNKSKEDQIQNLKNIQSIQNSLHNIFTWIPGERILNPEFGSNLRKILYNGITQFNKEQIGAEIKMSISKWEPRVSIEKIIDKGTINDTENNTVHLEIVYSIPELNNSKLYSYTYKT